MTGSPSWAQVSLVCAVSAAGIVALLWAARRLLQAPDTRRSAGRRLLESLGRPWLLAALVALVLVWGLTLVGASALSPGWKSTAVVAFTPRDPLRTDAETLTLLGPRYVALLDSPRLLAEVASETGATQDDLRGGAEGEIEPDTLVLRVRFSGDTAEESARGADALATAIVKASVDDPLVKGRIIAGAVVPRARTGPSTEQVVGLGWVAGVLAALFFGVGTRRRLQ